MQLSPHFSLAEMTFSQTATRYGLDNTPSPVVIANLQNLCINLLEPLRKITGPIRVSSGYRSSLVNSRVGGAANSEHLYGQAADITVPSMSNYDLACLIRDQFQYDQVILEFNSWVHVSLRMIPGANRKMPLTAIKRDGKTVYLGGIVAN